jgi:Mg-chelatase subunit ChlD
MNSKDMLARLLASENLNVIRARTTTASFDIKSRTLVLPLWKEMTEDVEDMLISHEVGHALFTTEEYTQVQDYRKLHGYLNVIEDVRIEKMMKNKYPGLRKCFISGYKQLNDKDFFGVKDKDLSSLLLIDRINIYYKCGVNSGVKFTPEEMEFVRRADKCDTIKDVHTLAREVYEYSFAKLKKRTEDLKQTQTLTDEDLEDMLSSEIDNDIEFGDEDEEADFQYMDGEYDPYTENDSDDASKQEGDKKYVAGGNEQSEVSQLEEQMESQTERALRIRLQDLADVNTIVRRWEPKVTMLRDENQIVPFQEIFKTFNEDFDRHFKVRYAHELETGKKEKATAQTKMRETASMFKTESSRIVNYLLKEFEMKKSATAYRRSKISKTGNLNVNKLAVYQLTDDVFKRITVTKDSKNHGMVFLLDWSGSMYDNMHDTLKQTITLAMFCQRAQIPFQVFAFSNGYDRYPRTEDGDTIYPETPYRQPTVTHDDNYNGFTNADVYMLELFNHKMTNSEFTRMTEICLSYFWAYCPRLSLNSTPLNESLLFMVNYIDDFKRKNAVEKLTFITLTDGEGGSLTGNYANHIREYETVYEPEYKRCKVLNYMVDPITKKEYRITQESSTQTNVLLKIIKDRYNATTIGFYIGRNSKRDLTWFVRNNITSAKGGSIEDMVAVENMQKEIRKNDFALLKNCGRDELYIIPASKLAINEEELDVSSEMNSKQIAKAFNKYLNVQKTNRILLNRFVGMVA